MSVSTRGAERWHQPHLFPVRDVHWPRGLAIALTFVVWLMPSVVGVTAATLSGNWIAFAGVAVPGWIPWTWATPKLVRFMITGYEGWDMPRRPQPPTLALVDHEV